MTITDPTREEESMLEHIVHIHLSERRFEVEEFDAPFSEETSSRTAEAGDRTKVEDTKKGLS